MATLTLDYNSIRAAYNAADKTAKECDECVSDIKSKVTKKIGELEMGANTNTLTAISYLDKKIAQLNKKHDAFATYSDRLDDFLNGSDGAIQVDKDVRKSIAVDAVNYRNSHGMQTTPVDLFFAWLGTAMDSTAFGRFLNDAFTTVGEWLDDVKYWYKCDGGKYVIKIIFSVIVLIAAVIILVVFALPALLGAAGIWAITVGLAGVTLAIISVANAATDLWFNCAALSANQGGDPAWAQRYDSYSSASTFFRKNRFETRGMNKASYTIATTIEVIEFVCAVICIVDMGINLVNSIKNAGGFKNLFKQFQGSTGKLKFLNDIVRNPNLGKAGFGIPALKTLGDTARWTQVGAKFVLNWQDKGFFSAGGSAILDSLAVLNNAFRNVKRFFDTFKKVIAH